VYDEDSQTIIQDDSLQGKDLVYSFDDFNAVWKKFNYEYLVLVPHDKIQIAERILREDADEKFAWARAVKNSENELVTNPNDVYARFNLSVALYNIGEYERSVAEFEKVEQLLPFRTLWYQIEPIQAYYELKNYDRVFEISDRVLNYYNRAFSELYIIRGNIYKERGEIELARAEYEKAVLYNVNLKSARDALSSV
jgi:tetratricopeptide (TPR) repeat protein